MQKRFVSGTILLAMIAGTTAFATRQLARSDATAQKEDLLVFERDFFNVDKAYTPAARAEARKRLDALAASAGRISDARFVLMLSQVVALADNGHTWMITRGNAPELARVGVRLAPLGTDFYVLRTTPDRADLLGGRLVAIDGVPVAQLRDSARTLTGGIPSWRDRSAPSLLESPGAMHAMGITRSGAQATYRFQMRDGQHREVVLTPVPDPQGGGMHRAAAILEPGTGTMGWRALLTSDKAPWSLRDWNETMRRRDAPEMDAMVIQLRANVDGDQPIAQFLEASEAARKAAGRRNIVLDMRMNGGGNLQLTREWMSSIVSKLPADGRVVVLTSPWTFSAAISSTGYLKQGGGARVVLAGESPGDRLRFFAEGQQPAMLPHSGAMVLMATQRHDYLTGCQGFTDCHGAVVRFPIAVKGLDPEVPAPWTLESYAAGRDPGMEAAQRILARK